MNTQISSAKRGDILVVDDTPDNLRLLSSTLTQQGYKVRNAISGAMALMGAQAAPPDLILLDVKMPDMDGFEVCQRLKADPKTQASPVIFLSALNEVFDKVRAFSVGGVDYITKPFQVAEVLARVENQLTLRAAQAEVQRLNQELEQRVAQRTQQLQAANHLLKAEIAERRQAESSLRELNATLESKVQQRTDALRQALELEATLQRITDKVRDSLDEAHVLQAVIQELAIALEADCCNTELPDGLEQPLLRCYQRSHSLACSRTRLQQMPDLAIALGQLQQEYPLQLCSFGATPAAERLVIMAMPIFDNQGTLGALWLFRQPERPFDALETRLVQQVANQCAIAIRQARLYQHSQVQVAELAKLNQLKDDFLSTVSHELRSPVSNMKMAIRMLELALMQCQSLFQLNSSFAAAKTKIEHYLQILQAECSREIDLINDLLDLQRLDAGAHTSKLEPIDFSIWIPKIVNLFQERAQKRQQTLDLKLLLVTTTVTTDERSLERILAELLHNACKYTPPGGRIQVLVQTTSEQAQIQVQNFGVEIPETELPYIFQKFYRVLSTDPWKQGGTGLGLALVQKLITYLGGTIAVSSQNQITTFTVFLPLLYPAASESQSLEPDCNPEGHQVGMSGL